MTVGRATALPGKLTTAVHRRTPARLSRRGRRRRSHSSSRVPGRASIRDTFRVAAVVALPALAQGVILRRPRLVGLAERLDVDRLALRLVQDLRRRHGPVPVRLAVPRRSVVLVVTSDQVRTVLEGAPEPFAPASGAKVAALSHFQPHGVLISRGHVRTERRQFNEAVLDHQRPLHHLAEPFVRVAREEAAELLGQVGAGGELRWEDWQRTWWRVVRRVVLGDGARDDDEITDLLGRLRGDANWAFLKPKRPALRELFEERLGRHLDRGEPGSLASVVAGTPARPETDARGQVPHWLFAFDAAGIVSARAMALLATHPDQRRRARSEIAEAGAEATPLLPFLRSCVLESVRLWPTTLAILRETTRDTELARHPVERGTTVVIHSSSMHRDGERLPYADRFAPDVWLDGRARNEWSVVPFSDGPAQCPGRDLVLLTTSALLAAVLADHVVEMTGGHQLDPSQPLPHTLDHTALRFRVSPMTERPALRAAVGSMGEVGA